MHQQQELVAALAGEDVAAADELADAARGLAQHLVAGRVAERVVDELEVVEVEVEERDRLAGAARADEVQAQLLLELRAVRQAGERVVVGEVGDLRLGAAALGDVLAGAQDGDDLALVVAQRAVAPRDLAVVAVLGPDERLERVARRLDAGDQAREGAARVEAVGGRDDRVEPVAPAQLVLGEAEQLAALAVDELDVAARVEDDDEGRGDLEVALRAVALRGAAGAGSGSST